MYGTIARIRVKPGAEAELIRLAQEEEELHIPGFRAQSVYRMDADSNEYYLVIVFDSREAYLANAASPEQDARYHQFRSLMESDPEWHDGEIVYQMA